MIVSWASCVRKNAKSTKIWHNDSQTLPWEESGPWERIWQQAKVLIERNGKCFDWLIKKGRDTRRYRWSLFPPWRPLSPTIMPSFPQSMSSYLCLFPKKKIKQINAQPHPPGAFPFNFEGKTRPLPRPSPFQENQGLKISSSSCQHVSWFVGLAASLTINSLI